MRVASCIVVTHHSPDDGSEIRFDLGCLRIQIQAWTVTWLVGVQTMFLHIIGQSFDSRKTKQQPPFYSRKKILCLFVFQLSSSSTAPALLSDGAPSRLSCAPRSMGTLPPAPTERNCSRLLNVCTNMVWNWFSIIVWNRISPMRQRKWLLKRALDRNRCVCI